MMNLRDNLAGMRRRTVLVTGGAGFIGSHIAEALHALGWHAEVLDNLGTGALANVPAGVRLHIGDIRSDQDLHAIMGSGRFDAIIHCAAQTSVERSMRDPDMDREVNIGGTKRLVELANVSGVRRFVFLSSGGAIYGETAKPADECTMPAPQSYYGLHKYVAEDLVRTGGLSYAILRPSNVYGLRQRCDVEGGVVAIFRQRLLAGQPLEIHGDGRQVRDFVHVSDVVSAVLAALATEVNVLWNVASGEATSVIDLAQAMAEVAGRPLDVRYRPRRAGDVQMSLLSSAKLLAAGLWGPPLPLAQGLRLTLVVATEAVPYAWSRGMTAQYRPSAAAVTATATTEQRSPGRGQRSPARTPDSSQRRCTMAQSPGARPASPENPLLNALVRPPDPTWLARGLERGGCRG